VKAQRVKETRQRVKETQVFTVWFTSDYCFFLCSGTKKNNN